MEAILNRQDGALDATLTLNFNKEDFAETLRKGFAEYGKRLKLPGYRPGKIPAGVIRKLAPGLEPELKGEYITRSLDTYLAEHNLELLLRPLLKSKNIVEGEDDASVVYALGLMPDIDLSLDDLKEVPRYKIEVDEADLDIEIANIQRRHATFSNLDTVENEPNMRLGLRFNLDNGGEEGGPALDVHRHFMTEMLPSAILSLFDGKSPGHSESLVLKDYFDTRAIDMIVAGKLDIEGDALLQPCTITLEEVSRREDAALDNELFAKYAGDAPIEDMAGFLEHIGKLMALQLDREADTVYTNQLYEALQAQGPRELPEETLRELLTAEVRHELQHKKPTHTHGEGEEEAHDHDEHNHANHAEVDPQELTQSVEERMDSTRGSLRWEAVVHGLRTKYPVEVNDRDVAEAAYSSLADEFERMGMGQLVQSDRFGSYVRDYLKKDENVARMHSRALQAKLMEALKESLNPDYQSIGSRDFASKMQSMMPIEEEREA